MTMCSSCQAEGRVHKITRVSLALVIFVCFSFAVEDAALQPKGTFWLLPSPPPVAACGITSTFMEFTSNRCSQCSMEPSNGGEGGNHSGCPLQSGFFLLPSAAVFSWHSVAEGLPCWGWLDINPSLMKGEQLGFCYLVSPLAMC